MPTNYSWISASPDIEIIGPTESKDVMRTTVVTTGAGVAWSYNFPPENFTPEGAAPFLERLSQGFNHLAANPHVAAVWTAQIVDRLNRQADLGYATVTSSSGKLEDDFSFGYAVIEPPQGGGDFISDSWVAARVAKLDAIENA